ncbi:major facilitator transporter [Ktedonobacter racemifer DSM 44963]|uniref:Major facilitator transporter n=2 Tax=Ktedonobacter racemifer TaxID=363277 RepID=D6TSE1_KTERA|nr:major facilitator transporter [Ktedonobacter racemifer DSM 44963]
MTGLSYLIAPALGGVIMQYLGAATLWRACLVIGLLIACAYPVLGKVQQPLKQRQALKQRVAGPAIGEAWGDD